MINIEDCGEYVLVRYEGSCEFSQLQLLVDQLAEHCRAHGTCRALADFRAMQGMPTTMQSFQLGVMAVEQLVSLIQKAALVYRTENFQKFTEDVIVNRGGNIRAFADGDAALRWLLI